MPKSPHNEIDDNDRTDELPVLVETVVLEPDEANASDEDLLEDTAERTAKFVSHTVELQSLQSDLAARGAQVTALEEDIARLNARWTDVERHLTAKDDHIEGLNRTLTELRRSLAERHAAEQQLSTELRERTSALERVSAENAEVRTALGAAEQKLASLAAQPPPQPAPPDESSAVSQLREEVASLATYIENRRQWWQELKQQAADATARADRLERDLRALTRAQREAAALAERESGRAAELRQELVRQAQRVEGLERELAAARASPTVAATPAPPPQEAEPTPAHRPSPTDRPADGGALTAANGPAGAPSHDGAEPPMAPAVMAAPATAFEVVAALEAEVGHKRAQIEAQLAELHERDRRLEQSAAALEQLRRELATARADLDQHRADRARLERTLVDKDRALEVRDARIATLQDELNQRLGAIQKLNAMDLSLQGLDSKMSDRLRADQTGENVNAPMLVCLTGDAPKQFSLTSKAVTIGRGHHCEIQIMTHFVSREHARIITERGAAIIEDLASTNGVFVNSVRVERQQLQHGDLVTIGETQFRFLESVAH
jgi:DNA repair exonuclease SbcCD ATPase subunit